MLARQGAEVIKVEPPIIGDNMRAMAPIINNVVGLAYMVYNGGKKSVVINLNDPEGIALIKEMIKDVDVITESFRPGVIKKFGLDHASVKKINPKIIYCSLSTYGQYGPKSEMPGYDIIAQAESGFMDLQGDPNGPPVRAGCMLGDEVGAITAYGSISAALFHRERYGTGQHIDVALLDVLVNLNSAISTATYFHMDPHRYGQHDAHTVPYGVYTGKNDQYLVIVAPTPPIWKKLTEAMNMPELYEHELYATHPLRHQNRDSCIKIIEGWLQQFDDINDAEKLLRSHGVPAAQVKSTKQMLADPHVVVRNVITELPTSHAVQATGVLSYKHKGAVAKFSETPEDTGLCPPDLGEHNEEILSRYGWSKEKIAAKQAEWAKK
jgi:crotonobetainyl-CoA:carnitine CoA-transferase CaiB-like acyl-CoA transferase